MSPLKTDMMISMAPGKAEILLVEDDTFIAGMYQAKLSMLGYTVRTAEDGEIGWAELQKAAPDILLLDVVLPKKDGFEVLTEIRKDPKLKSLPVILLTNLGQKPDVERGLQLGADDYIIKAHFTPSEVVEKVEKMLKKKK
jgi:DNA-binding response OmpR family regulator